MIYKDYFYVVIFMFLGIIFVLGSIIFSKILAPSKFSLEKASPYECGEKPIGDAWVQYNARYYIFAMMFVIFDVEAIFLVPWAVTLKDLGIYSFVEMVIFLFILSTALIYAFKKKVLEWV
ncbi:MAG: NADH-quinone oxidoreductase subunit A [Armatimonadetes bacterium]|nr:NADH-quinone oxidoreductase subunit A [Armatimonadota bacterium]